jgi:hypothetical protein
VRFSNGRPGFPRNDDADRQHVEHDGDEHEDERGAAGRAGEGGVLVWRHLGWVLQSRSLLPQVNFQGPEQNYHSAGLHWTCPTTIMPSP